MAKAATKKIKTDEELQAERDLIDAELGTPRTPDQADALFDAAERAINTLDRKLANARAKREKIAAEIEARREAAEIEGVELNANGILQDIDTLIANDQARIEVLKQRRNALDEEFRIRARRAQEDKQARQLSAHDAVVAQMMDAEARRLGAIQHFERNLRSAVEWLDHAFAASEELRQAFNRFDIVRPREALSDASKDEFVKRCAYRVSATLSTLGMQHVALFRSAGLHIFPHPAFPASAVDWRDDEARRFGPVIEEVARHPVKMDDGGTSSGAA